MDKSLLVITSQTQSYLSRTKLLDGKLERKTRKKVVERILFGYTNSRTSVKTEVYHDLFKVSLQHS